MGQPQTKESVKESVSQPLPSTVSVEVGSNLLNELVEKDVVNNKIQEKTNMINEAKEKVHSQLALRSVDELIYKQKEYSKFYFRYLLESPIEGIVGKKQKVLECYREHADRPLDCWQEVAEFKEMLTKAQQAFIRSF